MMYYMREVRTGDALDYVICDSSKWARGERHFKRHVPGPRGGKGGWWFQAADHASQQAPDPSRRWHKTLEAARATRPANPFAVWI